MHLVFSLTRAADPAATVTVNVTGWLKTDGFASDAIVVVVDARFTVCDTDPLLPEKSAFPS